MEDERIIELYWARDEEALRQTGLKYGPYCRAIALRILEDPQDSEECVSDAWLRAWNAIPPERPAALRAFLAALTRHLALNRARDASRLKRGGGQAVLALDELRDSVPDGGGPERVCEDRAVTEAIERWLRAQPTEHRVAFLRRYWYCDSVADVAARMGWPEQRTASLLRRLRLRLKTHLEQEDITL